MGGRCPTRRMPVASAGVRLVTHSWDWVPLADVLALISDLMSVWYWLFDFQVMSVSTTVTLLRRSSRWLNKATDSSNVRLIIIRPFQRIAVKDTLTRWKEEMAWKCIPLDISIGDYS